MRHAAASHPRITEEAAERLSRSKTREIQRALAENPAVPERIRVVAAMRAGVGSERPERSNEGRRYEYEKECRHR